MEKRKLKFRAWDKYRGKMVTDFVMAPTSPTWGPFVIRRDEEANKLLNKLDKKRGDLLGGDYTTIDCGDYYALENYDVLQFTGETDKHGQEVWEGSIVKCPDGIGEVCWTPAFSGWGIVCIDFVHRYSQYAQNDIKVLGNKYENPELLTR